MIIMLKKGLFYLTHYGFRYTWHKFIQKIIKKLKSRKRKRHYKDVYTRKDLIRQKSEVFSKEVKISILVPLYNTPLKFLREMIDSVVSQTYGNWELCLADGSDKNQDHIEKCVKQYISKDNRIRYKKLDSNLGISGNTNACFQMSTGDYIGLLDHDDILHPAALYEVMKAISESDADFIYTDEDTFRKKPTDAYCPHFKPDYSPDTLRSYNYICHFSVFKRSLYETAGGFRSEYDGSQDYDIILRLTERARKIVHIPRILYYWRAHNNSVALNLLSKPYVIDAAKRAISDHLSRQGLKGRVADSSIPTTYKINYNICGMPKISILIPNKDHSDDLKKCVNSIITKSTYKNYEIIIIENNSTQKETFEYYKQLESFDNVSVVTWDGKFNFSAIVNFGFSFSKGEHIVLLNNDTEVITPNWMEEMLMFSQRSDVGAVGCMLYYPDDTVQHAGVILGIGGVAGHAHKHYKRGDSGYMSRLAIAQNMSAVTAACLMIPRHVFERVGGFDENYEVAFNDVDFCMKIRNLGYLIVFTPYAELYHYESKSRGVEDTPEKRKRFENEVRLFQSKWKDKLEAGDPYYNVNLTLEREDFSLK